MNLRLGDCLEVMATLPDESVDAVVTDPPYGLEFMGKEWDRLRSTVPGRDDLRASLKGERVSGGTFGERIGINYGTPHKNPRCRKCYRLKHDHEKARCKCSEPDWDLRKSEYGYAMQWWHEAWAREAFRLLKPGGHLLAFGGTRTYHRLACAIEDAGFEIRDCLVWGYASGFPKSLNLPGGLGTALKPAWEPIVMARKPLRGTVAANVLLYSTGAINIDACRIGADSGGRESRGGEASPRTLCDDCLSSVRDPLLGPEERPRADEGQDLLNDLSLHDDERSGERAIQGNLDRLERLSLGLSERPTSHGASDGDGEGISAPAPRRRGRPSHQPRQAGQPTREPSGDEAGPAHLQARAGSCANCGWSLSAGRWPPNLLLTEPPIFDGGVDGVVGGGIADGGAATGYDWRESGNDNPTHVAQNIKSGVHFGDTGTYSRFFLIPKEARSGREPLIAPEDALRADVAGVGALRDGGRPSVPRHNQHPTVKPLELMRHLVRLVTPPGGLVLDPFLGSGTTAIACEMEGFSWIGIEKEPEYVEIAKARLNGVQRGFGLDVAAPTRKRSPSSGQATGYDWDESVNDNPTHVTRNIKSGVHYGDGPRRPARKTRAAAPSSEVWPEEVA